MPYQLANDVDQIKAEIVKNGPVSATLEVGLDYLSYKGGVYKNKVGGRLGKTTAKVIGYGKKTRARADNHWVYTESHDQVNPNTGYFMIVQTAATYTRLDEFATVQIDNGWDRLTSS